MVQPAWAAAILIIGLANFQPVRADITHREPSIDPPPVATATPVATTTPAAGLEPSPSMTPVATDTPSQIQPTAVATETPSASPSASPKPLTERINPALLRYRGSTTVPKPAQPLDSESGDHAADLLGGTWYCRTFAGSVMTHAFSTSDAASSLAVETQVPVAADRVVTLHESYARDAATGAWHVSLANGLIDASAGAWNGETWTFDGHQRDGTKALGFRMIFNRFGPDVFVRDFQHREGDAWQTFSGETCRRNVAP